MVTSQRAKKAIGAAVLTFALTTALAAEEAPEVKTLPASVSLGFERVRLPDDEYMGLVGAGYLFEPAPGWRVGPMIYGAASGQRGGLFTWGGEAQRRWAIGDRAWVALGLYAGGGGGAAAPVGGGLMLRPHTDLMMDFGGWQAGLSLSRVRFSGGDIDSTQVGLQLAMNDRFAYTLPGRAGTHALFNGRGGLGADRLQPVVGRYSQRTDATGGTLSYVGMRLEQQVSTTLVASVEAAGATSGDADGYMETLAGLSWQWPLGSAPLRVGLRGAIGLGGGGAVQTGGGAIAKAGVMARWQVTGPLSIDLDFGRAKAFKGDFGANYAQVSLGMALAGDQHATDPPGLGQTLHDMEWAISLQRYTSAQRKAGDARPIELVGLIFNRALSSHFYLSGQAHSAIVGGAGAFSVGLVGVGARVPLGTSGLSVGAEALAGAAGGGGVASQGGAVTQPMAWVGYELGRHGRLKASAGKVKSLRSDLSTPVVQLAASIEFGVP